MIDNTGEMLAAILDAMVDGIYIIRDDYTVEFMNRAMIEEFGEGTGEKCYRVINHLDEICPWCRAEEVFKGETIHWEHNVLRLGKSYYLREVPLKDADGAILKLSIFRDTTFRKKREERIKASEEDFKRLFEHVGCGVFISSR